MRTITEKEANSSPARSRYRTKYGEVYPIWLGVDLLRQIRQIEKIEATEYFDSWVNQEEIDNLKENYKNYNKLKDFIND